MGYVQAFRGKGKNTIDIPKCLRTLRIRFLPTGMADEL